MTESILVRTARGTGWILGWRITTRLLGLVNTLILVRLLVPGDFGLVALGVGFAKAIEGLSELGVEDALVRAPSPARALYDTGFTVNLIRGVAIGVIVALSAKPIAGFFNEPALTSVLLALAVATVIGSLENVGVVDFRRQLTFEREFQLLILPRIGAIAVTLICAMTWHNYWALVAGMLTMQVLRVGMTYAMHPFRPRLDLSAWNAIASFSLWSWAIGTTMVIRDRTDAFIIGRTLGTADVGVFALAEEVASIPTYEMAAPLGRAALSGFVADREQGGAAADLLPRIIGAVMLPGLPAGLGISLVADQVVHVAMGPAWITAVEPIRILGVAGAGWLFGLVTVSFMTAHGIMRPLALIGLLSAVVRVGAMASFVTWWGLMGAAWGWAFAMTIEHSTTLIVAIHSFRIGWKSLLSRIWRPLLAGAVMVVTLNSCGLGWTALPTDGGGAAWSLIFAIGLGAGVYSVTLAVSWLLCGRPDGAERDLIQLARHIATR